MPRMPRNGLWRSLNVSGIWDGKRGNWILMIGIGAVVADGAIDEGTSTLVGAPVRGTIP